MSFLGSSALHGIGTFRQLPMGHPAVRTGTGWMCDEPGSRLLWEAADAGTAALAQCLGTRQAPDAGPCASYATLQAARSDGHK